MQQIDISDIQTDVYWTERCLCKIQSNNKTSIESLIEYFSVKDF